MTKPSIRRLAWVIGRDVNGTLGGGNAAMELIRRRFVQAGWLDDANHGLLVAVSRLTPGTNILAYCAALGWQAHGVAGSAAALLAGSVPTAALVAVLSATLVRIDRYRSVQVLLAAGTVIAVWLVFVAAWQLIRPYLTGHRRGLALAIAAVSSALIVLDVTPVRILLVCGALGALWKIPAAAPASTRA
jgi:chromate transporter